MAADEAESKSSDDKTAQDLRNLSHKQRRNLLKKQKRKLKRQAEAKERDVIKTKEEEAHQQSPSYQARLAQEELAEREAVLQAEDETRRQHELWLWHEEVFAERLQRRREQEERERQLRLETERKIKEEWEERQKKEKEEEEIRRQKKEKQVTWRRTVNIALLWGPTVNMLVKEELLRQAREAENKDGAWHNPLAPMRPGRERQIETCPFFAKVGACRFGDRCSRSHPLPESGRTLMFTAMFRHFQLDQGLCEEYDTDIVLEYEDSEVYQKFREFHEDTLPEFKVIGHVMQFKVCSNFQPHLRGNVYVMYDREDEAMKAYSVFNARWYGGRQLTAQFVNIPSWRRAICGLYAKGRCPKGRECNFLHVFKNPTSEFLQADRDMEPFTPRHNNNNTDHRRRGRRSRSRSRDRRRHSRSPSHRHRRSRSRSPSNRRRHSRSRSRDRSRSYRSSTRRSRSRERRSRSNDRFSRSRGRQSRSRSKERYSVSRRHKSKSKSRSPENGMAHNKSKHKRHRTKYSRSRSRSRSRDRSSKRKKQKRKTDNEEVEAVWVEKTLDNDGADTRAVAKSKSPVRDRSRSRSSSAESQQTKHRKKKKRKSLGDEND